jgi:glycosyltransferase involved in cell wall biosynthesis
LASHVPLLTVAIPTCNGSVHLAETLQSILHQDSHPFDLLICDDRSDDDTVPLARTFTRDFARLVVNEHRLGLAGNWNQCMTQSRTPWVSIFHQDDVMLPGHLELVFKAIERAGRAASQIGLLAGPVQVIDDQSRPVPESVIDPGGKMKSGTLSPSLQHLDFPPGDFARFLKQENPLRCSAVVTNRAAHADVGGFDPSYRYVVDWEFWFRISCKYAVSWQLHEPTVLVRWHAASETQRFRSGTDDLQETARLLDWIFKQEDHETPGALRMRELANRKLSRALLNRAHEALRAGKADLARTCLARAWTLSSATVFRTLGTDPRTCVQLTTLVMWPRLARRWFAR